MNRNDLISSPEYWTTKAQIELYNCARKYLETTGMTQTELAAQLNVSKGYVSQLLNGDFDHRLSSFVKLAMQFGFVPEIKFVPLDNVEAEEENRENFDGLPSTFHNTATWDKSLCIRYLHGKYENEFLDNEPQTHIA